MKLTEVRTEGGSEFRSADGRLIATVVPIGATWRVDAADGIHWTDEALEPQTLSGRFASETAAADHVRAMARSGG